MRDLVISDSLSSFQFNTARPIEVGHSLQLAAGFFIEYNHIDSYDNGCYVRTGHSYLKKICTETSASLYCSTKNQHN